MKLSRILIALVTLVVTFGIGYFTILDTVLSGERYIKIAENRSPRQTKPVQAHKAVLTPVKETYAVEPVPTPAHVFVWLAKSEERITPEQKEYAQKIANETPDMGTDLKRDRELINAGIIMQFKTLLMMTWKAQVAVENFLENPYARENLALMIEYEETCEELTNIWNGVKNSGVVPSTYREYLKMHKAHPEICNKIK